MEVGKNELHQHKPVFSPVNHSLVGVYKRIIRENSLDRTTITEKKFGQYVNLSFNRRFTPTKFCVRIPNGQSGKNIKRYNLIHFIFTIKS